ncbi:MAG: hypothetical protein JXA64_10760 [Candidatus Fermentibacteraceae bacterium]|nr:hypothetical protein [Candidatus Fermentibacteraceae bacterium]MBN2609584.1 hypothetical protein [Candidatus Fermentibacteraceae bacterium]
MNRLPAVILLLLMLTAGAAMSQSGGPPPGDEVRSAALEQRVSGPMELEAVDSPDDAGGAVDINWLMEAEGTVPDSLGVIRTGPSGEEELLAVLPTGTLLYRDTTPLNGTAYSYSIVSYYGGEIAGASGEVQAVPSAQWLYRGRVGMMIILVILTGIILFYIESGKKGRELYIREIAGLAAVDDAVGRATEMGKPVLYIPGIMDMDDIQTIASMVILGRVARKTAEYGSPLLVPTSRSVVMSVAQEVVKEGYIQAGRPDAYNKENINYLTDDQFGYAAGVDGIMVREKPAAIFLLGTFYAESLILAETGRSVGAIQISGTAMPSQIPFFVAACDYTLIGEELFAASAYLSREPKLLGSLKGQDAAKLFFIILIVVGVIAATIGQFWPPLESVAEFLRDLVTVN